MKKNKTYTMLLAGGVILLWVLVLFRFYKSFWGEGTVAGTGEKPILKASIQSTVNDQFTLQADYPDPFSGKVYRSEQGVPVGPKKAVIAKKPEPKKEEIKVDFSFISYLGLIKNQVSNKQVALVSIHGKEYMVAEGEKVKEVLFEKNYKDSIKVSYMGATAYLSK